jgi:hypothetical protein
MAAIAAFRTSLRALGFSAAAATSITDDQEISSVDELKILMNADVVELCKALRRPGGTINNPQAALRGQPNRIPNPGINVPLRAVENLKMAAYYVRHYERISRPMDPAMITLVAVRALRPLKEHEESHEQPDEVPTFEEKDMVKTIDSIDSYLRSYLGERKVPLAYVTRQDAVVTPSVDDPPANYTTVEEEMIARAPHLDNQGNIVATFAADNRKVWDILQGICRDLNGWTWIKSFSRSKNGRDAYWALYNHYLGVSNADNVQSIAENKLQNTFYTGERRRFNFEKYVQIHKDCHTALEGLEEFGFPRLDDRTKVRHLLNGMRTDSLDAAKGQIWASPVLRADFEACVDLFKTFLSQQSANNTNTMNVSDTSTNYRGGGRGRGGRGDRQERRTDRRDGGRGRGRGGSRGRYGGRAPYGRGRGGRGGGRDGGRGGGTTPQDAGITDRYYNNQEFEDLGGEGRARVYRLREERDRRRGTASVGTDYAKLATAIVAATQTIPDAASTTTTVATAVNGAINNRNNPALQRTNQTNQNGSRE